MITAALLYMGVGTLLHAVIDDLARATGTNHYQLNPVVELIAWATIWPVILYMAFKK